MPRRIAVWVGSDSDLSQCVAGLQVLHEAQEKGQIEFVKQVTASIHRNPAELDEILKGLLGKVDVIIAGAGWANHLTGNIDARLRNLLGDEKIVVIGVAFEDSESSDHNTAAVLSITEVPLIFKSISDGFFEIFINPTLRLKSQSL